MRFEFHMRGTDGSNEVLLYDNEASTLTHADRTPVDLSPVNREYVRNLVYTPLPPLTPATPGRKSRRVERLKIQLGLGCNYSCSYCSQSNHVPEATKTSRSDADEFLENLDWLEGAPEKIELWGGEPLLYWGKIERLLPGLRERFPDATISMVTNGSLLDCAKVRFLREYRCRVTISHDGPGQALRGADPFDDPDWVDVVRFLYDTHGVVFNTVLTRLNLDPAAAVRWIRERLERPAIVNVESIVNVHEPGEASTLSDDELTAVRNNLFLGMTNGDLDDVPILNWKLTHFLNVLMFGQPRSASGQKCGMDRQDWLAVDLQGNVMTCQNTGAQGTHNLGHVARMEDVRLDTSTGHRDRPECAQCPVVHLCYGACMYLNGLEFEQTCRNEYAANLGVLQAAMYFLTNKVLTRVVPLEEVKPRRRRHIPIAVEVR